MIHGHRARRVLSHKAKLALGRTRTTRHRSRPAMLTSLIDLRRPCPPGAANLLRMLDTRRLQSTPGPLLPLSLRTRWAWTLVEWAWHTLSRHSQNCAATLRLPPPLPRTMEPRPSRISNLPCSTRLSHRRLELRPPRAPPHWPLSRTQKSTCSASESKSSSASKSGTRNVFVLLKQPLVLQNLHSPRALAFSRPRLLSKSPGAYAPRRVKSNSARSTALAMHSVRGTTPAASVACTRREWPHLASSTVAAPTRRRFSRKAFRDMAWGATCQGRAYAWTQLCATRFSRCFKNAMGTKTATLNAIQGLVNGFRVKDMCSGSNSPKRAATRVAPKTAKRIQSTSACIDHKMCRSHTELFKFDIRVKLFYDPSRSSLHSVSTVSFSRRCIPTCVRFDYPHFPAYPDTYFSSTFYISSSFIFFLPVSNFPVFRSTVSLLLPIALG